VNFMTDAIYDDRGLLVGQDRIPDIVGKLMEQITETSVRGYDLPEGYTTDGANNWYSMYGGAVEGYYVQAGEVYSGNTTYMQRMVKLTDSAVDGELSFRWMLASGGDKSLTLKVDGVDVVTFSAANGDTLDQWQDYSISLAKGTIHTVQWVYTDLASGGDDEMTAWIDDVVIEESVEFEYPDGWIGSIPSEYGYTADGLNNTKWNLTTPFDEEYNLVADEVYGGASNWLDKSLDFSGVRGIATIGFDFNVSSGGGKTLKAEIRNSGGYLIDALYPDRVANIRWTYTNTSSVGATPEGTATIDNVDLVSKRVEEFGYPIGTVLDLPGPPTGYTMYTPGDWFSQNNITFDDTGFAAQVTAGSGSRYLSKRLDLTQAFNDATMDFKWKLASGGDKSLTFEIFNETLGTTVATYVFDDTNYDLDTWYDTTMDGSFDPASILEKGNVYTLKWTYTDDNYQYGDLRTAWIDDLTVADAGSPVETFDPRPISYELPVTYATQDYTGIGTYKWGIQELETDVFAARAGAVNGAGNTTWMEREVDLEDATGSADVSFWWKTSDSDPLDKSLVFEVYEVDAVGTRTRIDAHSRWIYENTEAVVDDVSLAGGKKYVLKWRYENTADVLTDTDTAWVDDIIVQQIGAAGLETELLSDGYVPYYPASSSDPFATNYYDSRFQSVYLASELRDAGFNPEGGTISEISLKCAYEPGLGVARNFTIKMQHTSDDTSTYFVNSGWTEVFGPTDVTLTADGWYTFTLSTPFEWNGTDNILIDFMRDDAQSSWGGGMYVREVETVSYRTAATYANNPTGDLSMATSYNDLFAFVPQIKMTMPGDAVYVSDDFTAVAPTLFTVRTGEWEITDAPYVLAGTGMAVFEDTLVDYGTISYDFKTNCAYDSYDEKAVLYFGLDEDDNGYAVGAYDRWDGYLYCGIYNVSGGVVGSEVIEVSADSGYLDPDVWNSAYHNISMDLGTDGSIRVRLDGAEVINLTSSDYTPGLIGFGADYYDTENVPGGPVMVHFDNLTTPPGVYFKEDFEYPPQLTLPLSYPPWSAMGWNNQNGVSFDEDGFAAKADPTYGTFSRTIDIPTTSPDIDINFNWMLSSGDNKSLTFSISDMSMTDPDPYRSYTFDGNNYTLNWWNDTSVDTTIDTTLRSGHSYYVEWTYNEADMDNDTTTAWIDNIMIGGALDSTETFDPALITEYDVYSYGGYYEFDDWRIQNAVAHDAGGFSLEASPVYDGMTTTVEKSIWTGDLPADLSFWWKTSDSLDADKLDKSLVFNLYKVVGGVRTLVDSTWIYADNDWAEVDWTAFTGSQLDANSEYILEWRYQNMAAEASTPEGTAWIDDVQIVSGAPLADHEILADAGLEPYEWGYWGYYDDPFNVSCADSRSQTVYLAQELIDSGLTAGPISQIKVNVSDIPVDYNYNPMAIPNLGIRMQHTGASTSTGFVESGWTEVFVPKDVSVTETGWYTLTLDTPFEWDGMSNILVDFTKDGPDWSYNYNGGIKTWADWTNYTLDDRTCSAYSDYGYSWPFDDMDTHWSFYVQDFVPQMIFTSGGAQMVVDDNFTVEGAGAYATYGGTWLTMEDPADPENYIVAQTEASSGACMAVFEDDTVAYGNVSVDFKLNEFYDDALFYFGLDSNRNGYAVRACISREYSYYGGYWGYPYLYLYSVTNGTIGAQLGSTWAGEYCGSGNALNQWLNATHNLRVALGEDSSIKVFMDGEEATSLYQETSSYVPGDIGFGTRLNDMPVYFDNLRVQGESLIDEEDFSETVDVSSIPVPFTTVAHYPAYMPGIWTVVVDPKEADNTIYKLEPQEIYQEDMAIMDGPALPPDAASTIEMTFYMEDIPLPVEQQYETTLYFGFDGDVTTYLNAYKVTLYPGADGSSSTLLLRHDYRGILESRELEGVDLRIPHTIKVITTPERYTIFVDDIMYIDEVDYADKSGKVAIGVSSKEGLPAVYFDDLIVTSYPMVDDEFGYPNPFTPRDDGGNWEIIKDLETDSFVYQQSTTGAVTCMSIMKDAIFDEGTIETTFFRENAADTVQLYLGLDEAGMNGYVAYVDDSEVRLLPFTGGQIDWAGEIATGDLHFLTGQTHTLSIGVDGDNIEIFTDGKSVVGPAKVDGYTPGRVAIGTSNIAGPVWFDGVNIKEKTDFEVRTEEKFDIPADIAFTPPAAFGAWEVVDIASYGNVYRPQTTSVAGEYNVSVMDGVTFESGTIETSFKLNSTGTNYYNHALIYFGLDDEQNGYAASFEAKGISGIKYYELGIYKVVSGEVVWTEGEKIPVSSSYIDYDAIHKLKLEVNGNWARASIDGTSYVIERVLPDYRGGGIAIGERSDVRTWFDDIVVDRGEYFSYQNLEVLHELLSMLPDLDEDTIPDYIELLVTGNGNSDNGDMTVYGASNADEIYMVNEDADTIPDYLEYVTTASIGTTAGNAPVEKPSHLAQERLDLVTDADAYTGWDADAGEFRSFGNNIPEAIERLLTQIRYTQTIYKDADNNGIHDGLDIVYARMDDTDEDGIADLLELLITGEGIERAGNLDDYNASNRAALFAVDSDTDTIKDYLEYTVNGTTTYNRVDLSDDWYGGLGHTGTPNAKRSLWGALLEEHFTIPYEEEIISLYQDYAAAAQEADLTDSGTEGLLGLPDILEAYMAGYEGNVITGIYDDLDGNGLPDVLESMIMLFSDILGDGTPVYIDQALNTAVSELFTSDTDRDGIPDYQEILLNGNLNSDTIDIMRDSNADGTPDIVELLINQADASYDGNNDEIPDIVNALLNSMTDSDNDGVADYIEILAVGDLSRGMEIMVEDTDGDDVRDILEILADGSLLANDHSVYDDADADGVPDSLETLFNQLISEERLDRYAGCYRSSLPRTMECGC